MGVQTGDVTPEKKLERDAMHEMTAGRRMRMRCDGTRMRIRCDGQDEVVIRASEWADEMMLSIVVLALNKGCNLHGVGARCTGRGLSAT